MTVNVKLGDKYPVTFTANMDLTGCTVKLYAQPQTGSVLTLTQTVTNASGGVVTHVLDGTLPVGSYQIELEVTTSGGSMISFPTVGFETLVVSQDLS